MPIRPNRPSALLSKLDLSLQRCPTGTVVVGAVKGDLAEVSMIRQRQLIALASAGPGCEVVGQLASNIDISILL
jgi:hypothetical protein